MTDISENANAIQFAKESLLSDIELVLKAVALNGTAVRFADPQLVASHPGLSALRDGEGLGICGEYLILEEVGKGVYGAVTRAQRFGSQEMVAIKKLHYDPDAWADGIPAHALREVSLLLDFEHPNVVRLHELVEVGLQDLRLVFEYLPMDLHMVLRNYRRNSELMPMEIVRRHTKDLIAGVYACHCRSMVHRDLKPQNILVDNDGTIKLADFGLSRIIVSPLRSHTLDVVTLWYRAPEILLGAQRYGFEVDIWSAGCVFAEMCINHSLFAGDSEIGTIFKIFQVLGTPSETNWPEGMALDNFKGRFPKWAGVGVQSLLQTQPALAENEGLDLLSKLLCFDPQTRITSRRASRHHFCQL
jgi:cyclin-dependent kinase